MALLNIAKERSLFGKRTGILVVLSCAIFMFLRLLLRFVQVHCFIAVNANHTSFISNKCGFCRQRNNLQMKPLV